MRWELATNEQIKSIIEADGECPPHLLQQALEEAVRRDLYHPFMYAFVTRRFKAVRFAEYVLKMPFEEIKQILYIQAFTSIKSYKPGINPFLSYWSRNMNYALIELNRRRNAKKREAELVSIDLVMMDQEERLQLVADHNVERKVVNRITIEELLSKLTPFERTIVLQRNKDYTFPEIGKQLGGYSRGYIHNTYKKALAKMRGAIA